MLLELAGHLREAMLETFNARGRPMVLLYNKLNLVCPANILAERLTHFRD